MSENWVKWTRPGYFGKRRDEKAAALNKQHGKGNWKLLHVIEHDLTYDTFEFEEACRMLYEESYFLYLRNRKDDIDFICSHGECYDNALTNVQSGLDYTKQESSSTHIQDIAVRNVIDRLGRVFEGPPEKLLEIRSRGDGLAYSPGVVPFYDPHLITQPSLRPKWAGEGSVEDFWQSNKWVLVRGKQG